MVITVEPVEIETLYLSMHVHLMKANIGQCHPSRSDVKYIGQLAITFEHGFHTRYVGRRHR